jgi:hypothetical protein
MKAIIDPESDNTPELLAFKQRKREVQLAVSLVAKMSSYLSGDMVLFKERAEAETAELSESPMGGI